MASIFAFMLLVIVTAIRTISYGIYCIKNNSTSGAISVFFLSACTVATGFIILFCKVLG